ncbi:tartrate dehydrogenase, partial [Bacillus sp. LR--39]
MSRAFFTISQSSIIESAYENRGRRMTMKQFEIAAIPGDGVGKEVVAAAEKVLHTAAEVHG